MKRILFFLGLCISLKAYALDVLDDSGQRVHLTHPAQRIVSLAPDLTEILFAIGAGNKIVGVIKGSDYPEAAKKYPVIASYNSVDRERLQTLHPDLIVVWSESSFRFALQKGSVPIYYSHPNQLQDIPRTMEKLGILAGVSPVAHKAAQSLQARLDFLQKKYADQPPVTVFYELWHDPLITVTQKSWINEAIQLCGGENIFKNLQGVAPVVTLEAVLLKNPDMIVSTESSTNWKTKWLQWHTLTATQHHYLFSIPPDWLERAGPRLILGTEALCEVIEKVRHQLRVPT